MRPCFLPVVLSLCSMLGCISAPPHTASPEDAGTSDASDARPVDDGAITADAEQKPDVGPDAQNVADADTADASAPDMTLCVPLPLPHLHWSFDTLVGDTFPSAGAMDLPVTADGAVVTDAGQIGGAMDKTVENFPWIAHDPALELSVGTITFWFKAKQIYADPSGLVSKDARGVSAGHLNIALEGTAGSQTQLTARLQHPPDVNNIDITHLNSTESIAANQWYFVALRWSEEAATLFLDGEPVETQSVQFPFASNTEPIGLGFTTIYSDDGGHTPATGPNDPLLDELTFWDEALTDQQISTLFDVTCVVTP